MNATDPLPRRLVEPGHHAGRGSNLAFALLWSSGETRRAMEIFYAFCRHVDDLADEPGPSPAERVRMLDAWDEALCGRTPLPEDLAGIIATYDLDRELLREIVRGVRTDLDPAGFETFADLREYCWRVASAVGLASIRLFGCVRPESARYAEDLGLALQLTNILRDIREDAARGRIYLPREDLRRFGVDPDGFKDGRTSGDWSGFMRFQADRAEAFYASARAHLSLHDCWVLLPSEIMREVYHSILVKMRAGGFRVLEKRYRVPLPGKLLAVARAWAISRGIRPPNG